MPVSDRAAVGPSDPALDGRAATARAGRRVILRASPTPGARVQGLLLGTDGSTRSFMQALFDLPAEEVVRPEVHELVGAASASGMPVGLLTNDVSDFHGPVDRIVFADDQPTNVAAAAAVGLRAIRFDVLDPAGSVAGVRRALDLG